MRRRTFHRIYQGGVLLGLILGAALFARAANPRVPQLEQALQLAAPADRSALLVRLSTEIEADDMERAWQFANQARREAVSPADEVRADLRMAAIQRRRGAYAAALSTAQAALARAETLPDRSLRLEAQLVIANTHDSLADFPAALEIFRTLVPEAEQAGDARFIARVYNTLGVTYADANQPERARQAYETGRGYALKAGDQRMLAGFLNNLGNIAVTLNDAPLARDYHEKALALRESIGGDNRGIADSNQNLAEVAVLEGNPAAALPYLDRAIALHTGLGLKRNLANAQLTYATALRLLRRLDEVPAHLQIARGYAEDLKSQTILARVYRAYSLFHEARGEAALALDYERKYATATDAAVGERSRQRLDLLQARYDAERRQHEIDVLRSEHQVQEAALATVRWQRYSLGVVLVGVIGIGIAVISRQRLKHRAETRILAETQAGRAAAEAADALKTRLLHITSHDIRGPLTNVLHAADELELDLPPHRPDERIETIKHEAVNVLSLAQEILDSAALEKGALTVRPAPMDLAATVQDVASRLRWRATLKEQTIDFPTPAPEAGLMLGDAHRLRQVVANLVGNALKYSPPRKPIRLKLERDEEHVRFSVTDEGPGISPADQARLFVPFSRLGHQPDPAESSHGLGLSIAHELVRMHGGRVMVDSAVGHGSTFIVELPARLPQKIAPAAETRR